AVGRNGHDDWQETISQLRSRPSDGSGAVPDQLGSGATGTPGEGGSPGLTGTGGIHRRGEIPDDAEPPVSQQLPAERRHPGSRAHERRGARSHRQAAEGGNSLQLRTGKIGPAKTAAAGTELVA